MPGKSLTTLTLADATDILNVILDASDQPIAVSIADVHGDELIGARQDGCKVPSLITARNKAKTAIDFQRDTSAFKEGDWSAEDFANARQLNPTFVGWGGGVLILLEGEVVGAAGVSGLSEEEDADLAELRPEGWQSEVPATVA